MLLSVLTILLVVALIFLGVFITDFVRRRKSEKKYHLRESLVAYGLLLPSVILAFLFVLLPIVFSFKYAFYDYNFIEPDVEVFSGLDNFKRLFKELIHKKEFYYALRNTAIFVVLVVPLQIGLALLLALFCNNKRRGTTIFKICFFAPVAVSLSITAFLWASILDSNESGLLNTILMSFGMKEPQDFLKSDYFIIWIVAMSAWQGCGYQMLIFLSALGNIRKELYEAASIDGANAFRRFITITVPGLKPTFLFILITVFIGACRVLIQPMLLAPTYDTPYTTVSYYMYYYGLQTKEMQVGYSCAVALVMTIGIGTVTFIQRKLLGDKK
ncbi:MAG: sugar ABC transporter permease [Bacilli bacterium]|nr:sugar ABC transporter permease [Bacilli bacterium]